MNAHTAPEPTFRTHHVLRRVTSLLLVAAMLLVGSVALAQQPQSPTDTVKRHAETITTILGRPDSPARTEQLTRAVNEAVDFGEMASRALGTHWTARTDAERTEFLNLLQRLLQTNYSRELGGRQLGKDYTIEYGTERIRNDRAVVNSTVRYQQKSYPVTYRLTKRGDAWVIYDLVIDDMSLEETYRDGYVPIIEDEGWAELIRLMRERIAELEAQPKPQPAKAK